MRIDFWWETSEYSIFQEFAGKIIALPDPNKHKKPHWHSSDIVQVQSEKFIYSRKRNLQSNLCLFIPHVRTHS